MSEDTFSWTDCKAEVSMLNTWMDTGKLSGNYSLSYACWKFDKATQHEI